MARPTPRSAALPADAQHTGRHRRARVARSAPAALGGEVKGSQVKGDDDPRVDPDGHVFPDGDVFPDGHVDADDDVDPDDHVDADGHPDGGGDPDAGEEEGSGAPSVPLFSVPESLRSVDVAVGGRAVRGLLLVAAVLLLTLGGRWWWVHQQAAGVPVEQVISVEGEDPDEGGEQAPDDLGDAGADAAPGAVTETHAPSGTPEGQAPGETKAGVLVVMVHVVGRVKEPGVVQLPVGSRVIDAVQAAGGVTDEADPASLNLARPVVDGEQVWVGAPGEEPPPGGATGLAPPGGAVPGSDGGGAGPGAGQAVGPLDLNQADQAQLEELPGVGPVTASRILAWRESHGRFTAVEELMEVSGIGERTFEQLRDHVTVDG